MKKLDKYNRVAGYLNKLFDMLNTDFFDGELERPVITIQSSPKAYGHFAMDRWTVNGENTCEINLGAGTLHRPIEELVSTLVHEQCHMLNHVYRNNIPSDVSRGGTYHNKLFKETAEAHGLIVERSEKYGWSHTSCSDELFQWILDNELEDIQISRKDEFDSQTVGTIGGTHKRTATGKGNNSIRYHCPSCNTIVRATREVNVGCLDCGEQMITS